MSVYEDELWNMLARGHGAATARAGARPGARRQVRARVLATATLSVILAAVAIVVFGATGRDPAAYAVTVNHDGTVTLTINEILGIDGANRKLAALGLPVLVASARKDCRETGHPVRDMANLARIVEPRKVSDGLSGLRWVIHTGEIPHGDTLRIVARLDTDVPEPAIAGSYGLYRGQAPRCSRWRLSG
jgi:hypothetical protein